jgi:hypothetical protein
MSQGAIQGKFEAWAIAAKADLSQGEAGTGKRYKAVDLQTGDIAETSLVAAGLLQTCASSGRNVSAGYQGVMKFTTGVAISSAWMQLAVTTSGYMMLATSGDWAIGRNAYTVTSGGVVAGFFNFISPVYLSE